MKNLTKSESELLLAVITGSTDKLKLGKRLDTARDSLIKKGYLRVNEHRIIELNLADNYFNERGY